MSAAIPLTRGLRFCPRCAGSPGRRPGRTRARGSRPSRVRLPILSARYLLRTWPLCSEMPRGKRSRLPCQMVPQTSRLEVAMLGGVALGARTPGEALQGLSPRYLTTVRTSRCRSRETPANMSWGVLRLQVRSETKHTILEYAAMIIASSAWRHLSPRFARIEIPPYPVHKVDFFRRCPASP